MSHPARGPRSGTDGQANAVEADMTQRRLAKVVARPGA
jgi:hypothetical protein